MEDQFGEQLPTISEPGELPWGASAPQIDGYVLTDLLGQGGMGSVWRAMQLSTRREVALKVLGGLTLGSDRARARFEREVELSARLNHPNIARIHDSGLRHGVYYYAMELVDGLPMDEYVRRNGLSRRQIVELMRTVCQAVQHAHQRGVIHRDLKPSNILVGPEGLPHVLDFGLAKSVLNDEGPSDRLMRSVEGEVAGTVAYMSPEQAAGQVTSLDTRSDVYSLGVILFRLLTGQAPHDLTGAQHSVLRRIAEEEVCRPRQLDPTLDKELEAVLLKALSREMDRRYASAGELASDLSRYLACEPLAARRPTIAYFLRKRLRKYRARVAAGIGLAVVLAGLALGAYVRILSEGESAKRARDRAQKEAISAQAVTDFLAQLLVESQPVRASLPTIRRQADEHLLQAQLHRWGQDHPDTFRTQRDQAAALMAIGNLEQAQASLRSLLDSQRRALGEDHPDSLDTARTLTELLLRAGKFGQGEMPLFTKAVQMHERALGQEHPNALRCRLAMAFALHAQGRHEEAVSIDRRTVQLASQALGPEHRQTLRHTFRQAEQALRERQFEQARDRYLQAVDLMKRAIGGENLQMLRSMGLLAYDLQLQGQLSQARDLHIRTMATLQGVLGPEHPDTLRAKRDLACIHYDMGEFATAEQLHRQTLQARRRVLGADHPDVQDSVWCLEMASRAGSAQATLPATNGP